MKELAKQYDPSQVEDRIYQFWQEGGYFHTKADPDKKPYTIVMPPPNVTGQLHMGHAVDNTMQDILIRQKRMQGYAALWVPGTDHASIATEAKVVEAMAKEGLTKEMVGRGRFPGAGLGLEEPLRQPHRQPAEKAGQQLRLGAGALYHGRGLLGGCAGSVRPAVRPGPDLPGQPDGQLVPPLQHLDLGRRGGICRAGRPLLAPAVPGQGDRRDAGAGHHPPRDHAGRHRRGHQPRRPPLRPFARLPRHPAAAEQGDPHRLRRARRHDQGHRRGQDYPRPRPQRL